MPEIKWLKVASDLFDDEKIRLIEAMPDADTLLLLWIKLLCQAAKANARGYVYLTPEIPYSEENLSTLFGRPLNTIRLALSTFQRLRMIIVEQNGAIYLPNWEKYQNIEGMERQKELTRNRVREHRLRLKQVSNDSSNVTVALRNASRIEREKENLELDRDIITNTPSLPKTKIQKHKHGEQNNVLLSNEEYQKLITRFGEVDAKKWIETLSTGIALKGYKYKSHYLAIIKWSEREVQNGQNATARTNPRQVLKPNEYTRPEDL